VLLAIDTSAGTSVAVVDRDRGILSEQVSQDTRKHAEVVGSLIRASLDEAGVAVTALSGVAVGMGPGPFTGLRVGIAAARTFAFGAGKPVVPIVSHDAIAFGHFGAHPNEPLLVVTDARRREVYWTAYAGLDELGLPIVEHGPNLARPAELDEVVPAIGRYRRLDAELVSAASIGLLAESLFVNKRPFADDVALYLRQPDVTVSSGPKRVS